nr:L223 [uncultured bacterium]
MVSRRAFLRGGSLAGLASLVPAASAAVRPRATWTSQPFEAVCDTRHHDGDAFLAAVAPRAYRCHGVGADPGAVLGVVADATAAGRVVLGLTTPTTLMIARQVAAPHGYGLAFHGEHDYLDNDRLRHHLRGDAAWLDDLAALLESSADAWPQALGRSLAGLPADRECTATRAVSCAARQPGRVSGQRVSWMLAPLRA